MGALIYFTRELPGLSEDLSEHGFQVYEALAVSEVFYLCEQHPRLIVVIDHTVEPDSAKEIAARRTTLRLKKKSNGARCGIDPKTLLLSAVALWVTNILVFALWYWRLDAGGPHERERVPGHKEGAFLFPQMNLGTISDPNWSPNFVDYLFLAFNTSTALSPTDTPALSRWAKILMMIQATISLTILALLAARAVNIL